MRVRQHRGEAGQGPVCIAATASRPGGRVKGIGRWGGRYVASIEPGPVPAAMAAATAPPASTPTKKDPAIVDKLRGAAKENDPHGTALLAKAVQENSGLSFVESLRVVSERKGNTL